MICKVVWTEAARRDFKRMIRHIAIVLDSPHAAVKHIDAFNNAIDTIAEFPESHAISTLPALSVRCLRPMHVKNYVLLYSYDDELVTVYRIFHSLQDYARLIP